MFDKQDYWPQCCSHFVPTWCSFCYIYIYILGTTLKHNAGEYPGSITTQRTYLKSRTVMTRHWVHIYMQQMDTPQPSVVFVCTAAVSSATTSASQRRIVLWPSLQSCNIASLSLQWFSTLWNCRYGGLKPVDLHSLCSETHCYCILHWWPRNALDCISDLGMHWRCRIALVTRREWHKRLHCKVRLMMYSSSSVLIFRLSITTCAESV